MSALGEHLALFKADWGPDQVRNHEGQGGEAADPLRVDLRGTLDLSGPEQRARRTSRSPAARSAVGGAAGNSSFSCRVALYTVSLRGIRGAHQGRHVVRTWREATRRRQRLAHRARRWCYCRSRSCLLLVRNRSVSGAADTAASMRRRKSGVRYVAGVFVAADGYLLNTVEFGTGPRTFVAHGGWVGNWELWQEPFQLMQSRWRCVAYDHRGAGASTFPPESITPDGLVDDLLTVLDFYEVRSCVLAGESLGALTCLLAVLREPARFAGLVLVDGVPTANEDRQRPLVEGSRTDYPSTVAAFIDACVPEPDSEHVRRWGRQILLRADPEAAARILEVHYEQNVTADLSRVSMPTLVIHGQRDAIVPLAVGEAVAAAISGSELVVLPDAGHVPTLTRPQEVVDAIDRWATTALDGEHPGGAINSP